MRYYSEVDAQNQLYKQNVCTDTSEWVPSCEGLRLVIDELPEYDPSYQTVTRIDGNVPGDKVIYQVNDVAKRLDSYAPEADRIAVETFLTSKHITWQRLIYGFTGYSVTRLTDIYNVFIADDKWYVKVNDDVVIEWYEVTEEFGGFGVSRDLATGAPLDWYERTGTEITKHPMSGEPAVVRYYAGEPPSRGALESDYPVMLWSLKASGDIVIEYEKYKK